MNVNENAVRVILSENKLSAHNYGSPLTYTQNVWSFSLGKDIITLQHQTAISKGKLLFDGVSALM